MGMDEAREAAAREHYDAFVRGYSPRYGFKSWADIPDTKVGEVTKQHHRDAVNPAIDAFLSSLKSSGLVVVPVEATEGMVRAGANEIEDAVKVSSAEMGIDLDERKGDPLSGIFPEQREDYRRWIRQAYPMMVAAYTGEK